MASTDVPASAPVPPTSRPVRRRWLWLVLAGGVLLAGGLLAREVWGYREECAARQAVDEDRLDNARQHIDQALRLRLPWDSTNLLAARIARLQGAYSEAEQYLSRFGQRGEMSAPLRLEWLLLRCQRGEVDELAPELLAAVDRPHPDSPALLEPRAAGY